MYAYLVVVAFLTRAAHLYSIGGSACNATAECNVFGPKFHWKPLIRDGTLKRVIQRLNQGRLFVKFSVTMSNSRQS